jgi:cholesterol transport system auxiliary component
MRAEVAMRTLGTLCAFLLSGCALLSPARMDTTRYVLAGLPDDPTAGETRESTLLVLVPETAPVYATTQMAYSTAAYQVAYFSQNEWAATPSQMIGPLIVDTLRDTHHFREVTSPPDFGRHTFALRTEILELRQDFTTEPAMLRLSMRVYLSRADTNQVVASTELSTREPMAEKNPHAGVVAANRAMATLLHDLAKFVVANAG